MKMPEGPTAFFFIVIALAVLLLPGTWRIVGAVVVPVALMGGTVIYDKVKAARTADREHWQTMMSRGPRRW